MWRVLAARARNVPHRLYTKARYIVRIISSAACHMHNGGQGEKLNSGASLARDEKKLPDIAQVVVCGAGVVGASVAYHLPKIGFKDVILLEQGSIGGGTTWHAAGLLGQLRGTHTHTKLCMYGIDLYSRLEEEMGLGTGFKQCGGLTVAESRDRLTSLRRLQSIGRMCGVESEIVSPQECQKLSPAIRTDDLLAALWIPKDGAGTSSDICSALTKGASLQGVQVYEKVGVERVEVENGRVCGVRTNQGNVKCEIFINCGGMWSREIGQLSDPVVNVPVHASEHFYVVTKPMEGIDPMMPVVRDYCRSIYMREWSGGILAGGFEPQGKPCFQDGIPQSFEFQLLPEDWDHFQYLMDQILHRIPAMEHAEIRQMINGPESFTPDMHAVLGEAPQWVSFLAQVHRHCTITEAQLSFLDLIRNYFVAAGQNSAGIASAAGVGRALAEWIAGGEPPFDLWAYDIARFDPHYCNKMFLNERTSEVMGRHYSMPWPKLEMETSRNVKQSPFHSKLESARASWGSVMGWERPSWFAKENESRVNENTFGRPNWFDNTCEEHLACRESVAMFDLTSFAKFEIEGPDAEAAMQLLCTNNMAVAPRSIVYTGVLNQQGGYQTDCTVTRLSPNTYLAVCPSTHVTHMAAWITRHLPSSVTLRDITSHYAVLGVMGPQARDVLQRLTKTPLNNEAFPFATAQTIEIGFAVGVRALRISYVGELGWELHIPTEYALGVYDQVVAAGAEYGVRNAGMFALDSLRVEKGFRHWGHDLDTETTPLEARLGFTVNMKKGDFIGREALVKQKAQGLPKMLAFFTVDQGGDDNVLPWGYENIYRNGQMVGYVTSAVFGYTIGKPICVGYVYAKHAGREAVTLAYLREGSYEIDIAGNMCPAEINLTPLYDPKSLRVKM